MNYPIKIPQERRATIPDTSLKSAMMYERYPKQNTRVTSTIVLWVRVRHFLNRSALKRPITTPIKVDSRHKYRKFPAIENGLFHVKSEP